MIKRLTLRFLFLFTLYLLSLSLFAQKHFTLTVQLPQAINPKKLEVWLDNGKEVKKINSHSVGGRQLLVTGEYYSIYAAITLQYPPDVDHQGYANCFFLSEKPGTITFDQLSYTNSPFGEYSLKNVLDFKTKKKQMEDYCAVERKKAMDYEMQWGDKIFSGSDTAVRNYYLKVLRPALGRRKLEYIEGHLPSYYSFYSFRTEVAKPNIASWDSLLLVYNSFPASFKYSDEGNELNAFLQGQLSHQRGDAIDFYTKDMRGKGVSLAQFKDKKYVLLHFWATWCTPCMRELPALKQIDNEYRSKDLQIISIALKSNEADYKKTINKYHMDWIHIYNKVDLLNKYGNMPTPRICLVDKSGKLVYDNIGLGKNNDVELHELKEKLMEIMQKGESTK